MCEWVLQVSEKECWSVFSLAGIKSVRGELTGVVQICQSAQRSRLSCLSNHCQETTTCHHSVVFAFHGSRWVMSSEVVGGPENWTIITDSNTCFGIQWEIVLHGEEIRSKDSAELETRLQQWGGKTNLVLTSYSSVAKRAEISGVKDKSVNYLLSVFVLYYITWMITLYKDFRTSLKWQTSVEMFLGRERHTGTWLCRHVWMTVLWANLMTWWTLKCGGYAAFTWNRVNRVGMIGRAAKRDTRDNVPLRWCQIVYKKGNISLKGFNKCLKSKLMSDYINNSAFTCWNTNLLGHAFCHGVI